MFSLPILSKLLWDLFVEDMQTFLLACRVASTTPLIKDHDAILRDGRVECTSCFMIQNLKIKILLYLSHRE